MNRTGKPSIEISKTLVVEQIARDRQPIGVWPQEIRKLYGRIAAKRLLSQGPYLLTLGLLVSIATLAVDAVAMPAALREGAVLRILAVAPLTLLGLMAIARRWVVVAALCIGGSIAAYAGVILYLTIHLPPEITSRYIIAIALMPGLVNMVLPFTRQQLICFNLFFAAVFIVVIAIWRPEGLAHNLDVIAVLAVGQFASFHLIQQSELLRQRNFLSDLRNRLTTEELFEANRNLRRLSERDPLTGLFNRRHFEQDFERRFAQVDQSTESNVALMMIDLDHFKEFNDRHGHQAGDHCLRLIGQTIEGTLREQEAAFARFGGEEFVLVMREFKSGDAAALAARICSAVSSLPGRTDDTPLITTSIGVAISRARDGLSREELIEMADAALYTAKRNGRNRYEIIEAGLATEQLSA